MAKDVGDAEDDEEVSTEQTPGEGEDVEQVEGADAPEQAPEEQEAGEDVDVEDAEPPASRGSNRLQRLANENRELRDRLSNVERQVTQPGPVQTGPQEETEQQFQARIALLPPDERMEARFLRSEQRNQRFVAATAMQQQETLDKATFDAKAAVDERYKRYAPAVEAKRKELQALGQWVPREAVLKFVIGERVLANQGSKEVLRKKASGQKRIASQQARPSGGRSDVGGDRRAVSEAEARRRRLESAEI
jgi:hypothetical protein